MHNICINGFTPFKQEPEKRRGNRRNMRDIKFKAWDGKQMCEWKMHQNPNVPNDISFMFVGENGFCYPWEHPDLIKLQYTGLKDKNGKEIYEGDIIGWTYLEAIPHEFKAEIIFGELLHKGDLDADVRIVGFLIKFSDEGISDFPKKELEVIGNIHQDKELLK